MYRSSLNLAMKNTPAGSLLTRNLVMMGKGVGTEALKIQELANF